MSGVATNRGLPRSLPEDYGQLTESRDVAALTTGGRDLAGGLRLQVIAEGIETAAQAESLREMSCDFGRGFHFAKPLEASALEQLLRRAAPAGGAETASRRGRTLRPGRAAA